MSQNKSSVLSAIIFVSFIVSVVSSAEKLKNYSYKNNRDGAMIIIRGNA